MRRGEEERRGMRKRGEIKKGKCGRGEYLHGLVLGEDSDIVGRGPGGIGDYVGHHKGDLPFLPCFKTNMKGSEWA